MGDGDCKSWDACRPMIWDNFSIFRTNHKNYNFLACDWFKKVLFSTNSLAKLLSDSLLLEIWVIDQV